MTAAEGAPDDPSPAVDDHSAAMRLAIADWRREVHELYRRVRTEPDSAAAHALWVAGRSAMFAEHPASARMPGQTLRHAPYDPAFRVTAEVLPAEPARLEVPTGTDGVVAFERIGLFSLDGLLPGGGTLDVWWLAGYGNGVFVPVRDGAAGPVTYGAGRYLLDTVKGSDLGRVGEAWVLDFNFAYNPSCVYNPAWACPLAPAGNRLTDDLVVGELLPDGYGG